MIVRLLSECQSISNSLTRFSIVKHRRSKKRFQDIVYEVWRQAGRCSSLVLARQRPIEEDLSSSTAEPKDMAFISRSSKEPFMIGAEKVKMPETEGLALRSSEKRLCIFLKKTIRT